MRARINSYNNEQTVSPGKVSMLAVLFFIILFTVLGLLLIDYYALEKQNSDSGGASKQETSR